MSAGSTLKSVGLWFTRLWMLIWENAHIRWRTGSVGCSHRLLTRLPIFLLIETIWPLLLFLILIQLRGQFPPTQESDSLYRSFALPSAGTLPFLQTLICERPDNNDGNEQYRDLPRYPGAPINDVFSVLDEFGSLNGTLDGFCSTLYSLSDYNNTACVNSATQSYPQCQQDVVPLTCFLADSTSFQSYLTSDLHFSTHLAQGIVGATVDTTAIRAWELPFRGKRQLPSRLQDLIDIFSGGQITPTELRDLECADNGTLLSTFVHFQNVTREEVAAAVCALNDSQLDSLSQHLQQQISVPQECNVADTLGLSDLATLEKAQTLFTKYRTFMADGLFDGLSSVQQFSYENMQRIFCGINETYSSHVFFYKVLDLLRTADYNRRFGDNTMGKVALKILYTPDNDRTRSIVTRASKITQTFAYVLNWTQEIITCSNAFLTNFPPDSPRADSIRQVIDALLGNESSPVSPLFQSELDYIRQNLSQYIDTSRSALENAQSLLDPNAPSNIWVIVAKVKDVATVVHGLLDLFDWDVYYPMEDEASLESVATNWSLVSDLNITRVLAGVVFEGLDGNNPSIRIRMNESDVIDTSTLTDKTWIPGPKSFRSGSYLRESFLFIQDMFERAMSEEMLGHSILAPGLYMQQMPYPCFQYDTFGYSLQFVFPLAMLFVWLFPVAMTVRGVVLEKESRLKEYIKMMGVSDTQLHLSKIIVSGSVLLLSVVLITIMLKGGGVLPFTHWSILFLFLSVYGLVMIAHSFLIASLFNNANLAACVSSLVYFMVLFLHTALVFFSSLSSSAVTLSCLWAPLGFAFGSQLLMTRELQQVGVTWANISESPGADSEISLATILIMLSVDTLLYFLAAWYIEGVAPGRYGVAKPLYFPFTPSYWLGQKGRDCKKDGPRRHRLLDEGDSSDLACEENRCEEEPANLPLGISIENLTKIYRSNCRRKKVTAIKDLSLNFFEGQITALLGHNGAGKTTTLSILAGLFEPTNGTANIYGNDIRQHMDLIRQGLGICPQHNILISELTVEEHLLFFGLLKRLSWKESKKQTPEWLSKVGLLSHATKLAKHLSGGMKRKLSILLAFVGGSRTIILDEPTAGVDTFARRQIWDFLLRNRDGRTIIMSTHHMDEAEILGDRIAVVSKGSLICCGSFEFLKQRFGRGHKLTLVTASQSTTPCEGEDPQCDRVEAVTEFLESFMTSVTLDEVCGRELRYLLPFSGARASVLTQLFRELEGAKEHLGVVSYGLTACSMEEIFIELTEKDDKVAEDQDTSNSEASVDPETVSIDQLEEPLVEESVVNVATKGFARLSWLALWWTQFVALMVKRFHYTKRRVLALLIQNVLPAVVIAITLLVARSLQTVNDPPPLELSPEQWFTVNRDNYMFVAGYNTNETSQYIDTFSRPCGVGGHRTSDDPSGCFQGNGPYTTNHSYTCDGNPPLQYSCTCGNGTNLACNDPGSFPNQTPLCYNGTGTGSRVQDMTQAFDSNNPRVADENLATYLLHSKQSFVQRRYGGLSFGYEREEFDASLDAGGGPFLATRAAAKVWFSLKGYHASPTYINVANNALLKGHLEPSKQSQYGFKTFSHPFPTSDFDKQLRAIWSGGPWYLLQICGVTFSLGFVVAGFVLLLIEERSSNVKHLQLVCGMKKAVYWLANISWDFLWYIGFTIITVAIFLAFQDPYYTRPDTLPLFVISLLSFGLAITPWVYIISFLFQSPATAYVVIFCMNFMGGFGLVIVDLVFFYQDFWSEYPVPLYYLAAIPIPAHNLARCLMYIGFDFPMNNLLHDWDPRLGDVPDPYARMAPYFYSLLAQAVFFTLILMLIEVWPYLRGVMCRVRSSTASLPLPLDTDDEVCSERSKVKEGEGGSDILTIEDLSRVYHTNLHRNRKVAVNQLCLGVKKGECFGLLGVNGAGKTTTFKMLTGDIRPSAGDAMVAGHKLSKSRGRVQQSMGYCPQVDALIDQLTGRQHLTLFSRLRGVCGRDMKGVVQGTLDKLGLSEYADRPVGAYSGGNRRKLSTAIALLAQPPVVLLDEPTSGVDPRARHFLWSLIRGLVRESTQSVVLTTHSMAECEALCSRVAIMVNGEFHCLGSPQQLKSTYGNGYKLKLRVAGEVQPVKEFVSQAFSGAMLKEEHYTTLLYQLPTSEALLLHTVFETMEGAKDTLGILDYNVSQTTLDDVFIHFANRRSEGAGLECGVELPDIIPSDVNETTTL